MKVDLLPIKAEVVAVDQDAPAEQVAETLMHLETVERAVKDVRRTFDDAFRSWLEQHGSLTVGEIRYYVGEKRETKVVDKAAAFDALVQATGGDAASLAEVLTASPFKVAAAREVLGDLFDQHFQTIVEIDTKEGKPVREVKALNPKFVRKPAA